MDIATIIGITSGIGCILFAIILGSGIGTYINIPSVLITVGGTFAATLIAFPLPEILKIAKVAIKVFKSHEFNPAVTIPTIVGYAEQARQGGILSLENAIENVDDEFLKLGVSLIVDGTNPEEVRDIMETELEYLNNRHKRAQELFLTLAKYSPAYGMIGTLIGLIAMLKNMDDPSSIGPAMAVSLITTFYGSLMANLVFLPIAGKLKTRTADELLMKQTILEGIMMIQAQTNPRFIGQKLVAFLPPSMRAPALRRERVISEGMEIGIAETKAEQ